MKFYDLGNKTFETEFSIRFALQNAIMAIWSLKSPGITFLLISKYDFLIVD